MPLRVGVIGAGAMGQNHARVYSEIAHLAGVADPDIKAGGAASNRFNTDFFPDYRALLLEPLDAVSVCVPTSHHKAVALDVIERGIDLLVEKPLAGSVVEAQAIVDAADDADVTLSVGHVERYNPVISVIKQGLQADDYGDLITLSARRVSSIPSRVRDVGVVMDLGVHDIDILRYLANSPVESVYSLSGRRVHDRFEDHANLLIRFETGVHGFVEVNWLTPMKVRRLSLTCLRNYVEVDYIDQTVTVSSSTFGPLDSANLYQIPLEHHSQRIQVRREEPLKRELQDFLDAVKRHRDPLVTGADAVETLRVAEAAIESHQKGQVVRLPPRA